MLHQILDPSERARFDELLEIGQVPSVVHEHMARMLKWKRSVLCIVPVPRVNRATGMGTCKAKTDVPNEVRGRDDIHSAMHDATVIKLIVP